MHMYAHVCTCMHMYAHGYRTRVAAGTPKIGSGCESPAGWQCEPALAQCTRPGGAVGPSSTIAALQPKDKVVPFCETRGNSGDLSAKRVFSVLVFFSCVQVGFQYLLMLRLYVLFVAFRWGKLSLLQLLSYQLFFVCSEFHVKDIIAMQANDRS